MTKLGLILLGGAAGALGRYALAGLVHRLTPSVFPWGTLCVNLLGCFLIGFLWEAFDRAAVGSQTRALVFIGGLGAFTTFSTFGLETVQLLRDNQLGPALWNVGLSNALGIALVFVGMAAARGLVQLAR